MQQNYASASNSTSDKPCLKILGQEFYYPNNDVGAKTAQISFLIVGCTVCLSLAIVYIFATESGRRQYATDGRPTGIDNDSSIW